MILLTTTINDITITLYEVLQNLSNNKSVYALTIDTPHKYKTEQLGDYKYEALEHYKKLINEIIDIKIDTLEVNQWLQ